MPLPQDWNGAFWGPGAWDNNLFDLEPPQIVEALLKLAGMGILPYLITGAYLDLKKNGHADRASQVIDAAKRRISFVWDKACAYADKELRALVDSGVEPEVYCTALDIKMRELWTDKDAPPLLIS